MVSIQLPPTLMNLWSTSICGHVVCRYEGLVSSFLGETAGRLDQIFVFTRTRHCVLLFYKFDMIAKERADAHETGEIKGVVSTLLLLLLLQIDRLPAHVIVVCATNHGELLDRAAWRRFQLRLAMPAPTREEATRFLETLSARLGGKVGLAPRTLADKLHGASCRYAAGEFPSALLRFVGPRVRFGHPNRACT